MDMNEYDQAWAEGDQPQTGATTAADTKAEGAEGEPTPLQHALEQARLHGAEYANAWAESDGDGKGEHQAGHKADDKSKGKDD